MKKVFDIRVMGPGEDVEDHAKAVAAALEDNGLEVIEVSMAYPCREPNEHKRRVFIKAMTRENGNDTRRNF